ncbi:MAG: peptidase M14 [Gammaproteobacteria bacterium]
MLTTLNILPPGLLDAPPTDLYRRLTGPTLIHIEGERREPLVLAALLHGNETSAWSVLRELFAAGTPPARSVLLFVGNVAAARAGLRNLDGQPDFNRIWLGRAGDGSHQSDAPEYSVAMQVLEAVHERAPYACVDLHNTTGRNPHHVGVARRDPLTLALARRFSPYTLYAEQPDTTLVNALSATCPAFTLECGQPGDAAGIAEAVAFVREIMASDSLAALAESPISRSTAVCGGAQPKPALYRTIATVTARDSLSIAFTGTDSDDAGVDVRFVADIDRHNFRDMRAGEVLAVVRNGHRKVLEVKDFAGNDVTDRYFRVDGGALLSSAPLFPALLTTDARIVHQDCLCYLMDRL